MDAFSAFTRLFTGAGRGAARTPVEEFATSYGDFTPKFYCNFRRPRTNDEAQNLYNHVRTVAWYMDAAPFVSNILPIPIGIDGIISAIPIYGDLVGMVLSLYQVFLSWIFGAPYNILGMMIFYVFLDTTIGIVPIIGDILDVLFKANLRNLTLLEDWLLKSSEARIYNISIPPSDVFLPRKRGGRTARTDPKDKYRNIRKTTRMKPADLD